MQRQQQQEHQRTVCEKVPMMINNEVINLFFLSFIFKTQTVHRNEQQTHTKNKRMTMYKKKKKDRHIKHEIRYKIFHERSLKCSLFYIHNRRNINSREKKKRRIVTLFIQLIKCNHQRKKKK
jgi:hypothetical protein